MTTRTVDPGKGLIDVHALVVRHLRADTQLAALVGKRVYARSYPDRVTLPACRISFPGSIAIARPTSEWWVYDGQVECHADTHVDALEVSKQVQRALLEMERMTHPEGAVNTVDAFGVQSGFDEEWTPAKPRWIVSAAVVARGH